MSKTQTLAELELYVSPETAKSLVPGCKVTVEVADFRPYGNGVLVVGSGCVEAPDIVPTPVPPPATVEPPPVVPQVPPPAKPVASSEEAAATGDVSLSGEADRLSDPFMSAVGSVIAAAAVANQEIGKMLVAVAELPQGAYASFEKDTPASSETPPPAPPAQEAPPASVPAQNPAAKAKFGKRGPQLAGLEETPAEIKAVTPEPPAEERPPANVIATAEDFYKFLEGAPDLKPGEEPKEKRLDRSAAVKMEAAGRLGPSIWIINQAKGQLVLNDLGVALRYGDSFNLSSVNAAKLKRSVDLFEALSRKLVRIATPNEAAEAARKTQKRIEKNIVGNVEVFDSADQAFDEIENAPWPGEEGEDSDDGFDRPQPRRKAQSDDRFRRGIAAPRRRNHIPVEDEDAHEERMARASVRAPAKFRDMEGQNVLDDDEGEMSRIERDVQRRESELVTRGPEPAPDEPEDIASARRAREDAIAKAQGKETKWSTVARLE